MIYDNPPIEEWQIQSRSNEATISEKIMKEACLQHIFPKGILS